MARRLPLVTLALAALLLALPAQRASAENAGTRVQRVVSLLPSLTETVCLLQACERLVGLDRYSNWPAALASLPRVGGGLDPSLEAIVSLRPDLVLMAKSARGAERMRALGLRVVQLEPQNLAQLQTSLDAVGQALGLPVERAPALWREVTGKLSQAGGAVVPAARNWSVYVEVSPVPHGASESSFIGEILKTIGLRNVLAASLGPFPMVQTEWMLRAQPDAVVLSDSSLPSLLQRPGWSQLRAVRDQRICVLSGAESDLLVRAGPRVGEAAQLLVDCVNRLATRAGGPR